MPRGRKPVGDHALSNAERQARYRRRRLKQHSPVMTRTRRPTDRRNRPQRWADATNVLLVLQAEYVDWLAALPDSLRDTPTAEALEAIADLDLTALAGISAATRLRPGLTCNEASNLSTNEHPDSTLPLDPATTTMT